MAWCVHQTQRVCREIALGACGQIKDIGRGRHGDQLDSGNPDTAIDAEIGCAERGRGTRGNGVRLAGKRKQKMHQENPRVRAGNFQIIDSIQQRIALGIDGA